MEREGEREREGWTELALFSHGAFLHCSDCPKDVMFVLKTFLRWVYSKRNFLIIGKIFIN